MLTYGGSPYVIQISLGVLVTIILTLSWDMTHRVGYLNMAQAGMFGTGGYAVAMLAPVIGPYWAWIGGIIACVPFALVIGAITLRLKGFYFNLATLAFTVAMQVVVTMWSDITGGASGISPPVLADGEPRYQLLVLVGLLLGSMVVSDVFLSRKRGPALAMIRSHPEVAAASGIRVTQTKIVVFVVSSMMSGVAGAAYATLYGYVVPDDMFNLYWAITPIASVLLGGADSTIGAIIGASLIRVLEEVAKITIGGIGYQVVYGVVIIIFVLVFPGGIVALFRRLRQQR
jgi:branched-chain amino acid transport system permease protein